MGRPSGGPYRSRNGVSIPVCRGCQGVQGENGNANFVLEAIVNHGRSVSRVNVDES